MKKENMKIYRPIKYNIITPKPINFHFNLDTDRDRVLDWKDCQPFNPLKQGALHDIKRAVKKKLGREVPSRAQELQSEIESYKVEKDGYSYKPKPKQYGEKGYAKETTQEIGQGIKKVATKGAKVTVKGAKFAYKAGKFLSKRLGEETEDAGVRSADENIQAFKSSLRPQPTTRKPSSEVRVIREPGKAGMPPQPPGWWRGSPQPQPQEQPAMEYQQIPEGLTPEETMAYQQYQQQPQPRKLPPLITRPDGTVVRVQEYQPVTLQQSFLPYRPLSYRPTGREYSKGNQTTRPPGIMPIAQFRPAKVRFATFGRKVRE